MVNFHKTYCSNFLVLKQSLTLIQKYILKGVNAV